MHMLKSMTYHQGTIQWGGKPNMHAYYSSYCRGYETLSYTLNWNMQLLQCVTRMCADIKIVVLVVVLQQEQQKRKL